MPPRRSTVPARLENGASPRRSWRAVTWTRKSGMVAAHRRRPTRRARCRSGRRSRRPTSTRPRQRAPSRLSSAVRSPSGPRSWRSAIRSGAHRIEPQAGVAFGLPAGKLGAPALDRQAPLVGLHEPGRGAARLAAPLGDHELGHLDRGAAQIERQVDRAQRDSWPRRWWHRRRRRRRCPRATRSEAPGPPRHPAARRP